MAIQLHPSFLRREKSALFSRGGARSGLSPFAFISLVVFTATVALAAGVFVYRGFLIRDILAKDAQLTAARKSFEPEFVEAAARFDARIEAASRALSRHLAPSLLFAFLERRTLEAVRFTDFSFDAGSGQGATLSLSGEAKSFNAVALQSDVFGEEKHFINPVFSNFALSDRGNVLFQFKAEVDSVLVAYRETRAAFVPASVDEETPGTVFDEPSPFESGATE